MAQAWRNTRDYRIWRVAVVRRDGVCQICRSRKDRQAHHLDSASYHVESRFNVDNGVTLCGNCHRSLHIDFCGGYRKKTVKKDYTKFKKITRLILKEVA